MQVLIDLYKHTKNNTHKLDLHGIVSFEGFGNGMNGTNKTDSTNISEGSHTDTRLASVMGKVDLNNNDSNDNATCTDLSDISMKSPTHTQSTSDLSKVNSNNSSNQMLSV